MGELKWRKKKVKLNPKGRKADNSRNCGNETEIPEKEQVTERYQMDPVDSEIFPSFCSKQPLLLLLVSLKG